MGGAQATDATSARGEHRLPLLGGSQHSLPLGAAFKSGWRDSNPRPLRPKRSALTKLRYSPSLSTTCRHRPYLHQRQVGST